MLLPKFLSRKKLSRKIARFLVSKISPATGVRQAITHFCREYVVHVVLGEA
jgi:hypothetical protein